MQVGLTGSIGMGKSTIAKQFTALGFPVFDADAAVHALYGVGGAAVPHIRGAFPAAVVDGAVSRPELSKLVLSSPSALKQLEDIVHPLVRREREAFFAEKAAEGHLLVLYDIPLLFENPAAQAVDYTIVASAGSETQKLRVLARPNMTPEKLQSLLDKQMPDAEKRKRADFVVLTDVWPDSFAPAKAQVAHVLENIIEREPEAWRRFITRDRPFSPCSAKPASSSSSSSSSSFSDKAAVDRSTSPPPPPPPLDATDARIRAAFDLVLFDLDDTLVPVFPPLQSAATVLASHLQASLPRTHALLMAEGGGNISRALGARMKIVGARLPLLAHDLSELRRLALLDALRESKSLPPIFGLTSALLSPNPDVAVATTSSSSSSSGGGSGSSSPSSRGSSGGSSGGSSPSKFPDQAPFIKGGSLSRNIMADALAVKHSWDLATAAGAGSMIDSKSYRGLSETEVGAVQAAMNAFLKERSRVEPHLYADALPCLEYFKGLGLRLGIVTNGNADLEGFAGGGYFESLCLTSSVSGSLKPSPVPFLAALQLTGAVPSRVLYVGDAVDKDVVGANSCGMVSCWLNRAAQQGVYLGDVEPSSRPACTVASLEPEEIKAALKTLLLSPSPSPSQARK